MAIWRNWSGAVRARPQQILRPASEEELAETVVTAPAPVRVAGSGHSFTPLCQTRGTLILLDRLNGVIGHDAATNQATVRAGTTIRSLGPALHGRGLSLINQGDVNPQTISGAVSTGTHGTGKDLGSLSALVTGLRLITAAGETTDSGAQTAPDVFNAARVSLGALGIITRLTLQCRPVYRLEERSWVMPARDCLDRVNAFAGAHRHFEFFWFPYSDRAICKSLSDTDNQAPEPEPDGSAGEGDALTGSDLVAILLFELARTAKPLSASLQRLITWKLTKALPGEPPVFGKVRWSHEAFPSVRAIRFNEMEYAVPREAGVACLTELVETIRSRRIATGFPIEFRLVAGDDIWLSPFHDQDSATIAVHQYWKQDCRAYFAAAEEIFLKHGGRPHWGKMHSLKSGDLAWRYPHWNELLAVRERMDPEGRLLNPYLRELFGVG